MELDILQCATFTGLGQLKELQLNNNNISLIDIGTFKDITGLLLLHLGYNQISILQYAMFEGLGQLEELWLNNNNISHIDKRTFRFLENLLWLYLQYTK